MPLKTQGRTYKGNRKEHCLCEKKGLSKAMIDRLALNDKRINEMAQGLIEVAALPDPVGEVIKMWQRPNGMVVGKMRVLSELSESSMNQGLM